MIEEGANCQSSAVNEPLSTPAVAGHIGLVRVDIEAKCKSRFLSPLTVGND